MRLTPNLFRSIVFLCLPTIAVVCFACRFAVTEVPRIVANEQERVTAQAEVISEALLADPSGADFVWRRGKGIERGSAYAEQFSSDLTWKDWPSMGRPKAKEKWGYFMRPEGLLVWVRDTQREGASDLVYGCQTDLVTVDYARAIHLLGGFSLLVLMIMTAVGVRFFVDSVRSRDDFMAATAHDLTTPLAGLRYMIGHDDQEARVLNERLIRLVENVKDFIRLGGKRRAPVQKTFDLLAAYREAYALFKEDYRDLFDGADVPVTSDGEGPFMVQGDETMTVQILWNLLGNDLKYAAPYGPVRVIVRRAERSVAIDFVDEGPGMTRRQRARAFDRYYRAKTVLESGKGGFGIGLCTAREFAEAMGGTLIVRANAPKGCLFTLTLPTPPPLPHPISFVL